MTNDKIQMTKEIENAFTNHAPKEGQVAKYEEIRETAKKLAYTIECLCPNSREKALARTNLEQADVGHCIHCPE